MVTFHESRFYHDVIEAMLDLFYNNEMSTILETTSLQMYILGQAWDIKKELMIKIEYYNIELLTLLYETRMITTRECIEYCELYDYLKDSRLISKIQKNTDVIYLKYDEKTVSLYFDKKYIDDHKDYFMNLDVY